MGSNPTDSAINVEATPSELEARDGVLGAVLAAIREDVRIKLPAFDPATSRPGLIAPVSVGIEPNPFGSTLGEYRYQFEGEDDLLHLMVTRLDGGRLSVEEAQAVAGLVLPGLPASLVWLRPGEYSHHFYLGHDELLRLGL